MLDCWVGWGGWVGGWVSLCPWEEEEEEEEEKKKKKDENGGLCCCWTG